jgi:hypothetical protein
MSTFGRVRRVLGFFEPPIVACAVEFGANERRRRLLVASRRKFAKKRIFISASRGRSNGNDDG